MKELSIEEKAKRYDGAIEQLRAMMPNWESLSYNGKTFLQDLVHIIPELKESEDWIPKEIIKYLKEKGDFRSCWIAWLEKQGEQKPTIEMKTPEESLGINSDTYNKIVDECIYGEQKPAWSEEDEMHIRELESLVKQVWATAEHENDKDTIHKMSDLSFFLKTLKPQPKQEWSEEDEQAIEDAETWLDSLCDYLKDSSSECISTVKEVISKLKSIRPQNTWKPSDEQMGALDDVIDEYDGYPEFDSLVSLKNDLKKLMEE